MGVIQEKMANLDASWNKNGDKYCVGSSSGNVYVGRYYADNNFWVAHSISKKPMHKASVVCVKFDSMSGRAVASASLDGSVYITSSYYEDLDQGSN
jgi:WD40 repeat protein